MENTNVNPQKPSLFAVVLDFIKTLLVSLIIVSVLWNYVLKPVQVQGSSMYPTLETRSVGFSNILGYRLNGLKRFDIVIIYLDNRDEYLVKRVVGLPGETVSVSDNKLYIDGSYVEEPFLNTEYARSYEGTFTEDIAPITLGEDEYYCLGDNRISSRDSRVYGPFRKDQMSSKGIFILYPFRCFGVKTW